MSELVQIAVETPRLTLRDLTYADVTQAYADWLNDPQVSRFLAAATGGHTLESCREYVSGYAGCSDRALVGIFSKPAGEHIGNLTLSTIDWRRKTAAVGVSVGRRECWGHGLGREALCALRDFCFTKLGLHRLEAKVSVHNSRSVSLFLRCGFIIEGHLRDSDIIDGEYHGGYQLGILESDRR